MALAAGPNAVKRGRRPRADTTAAAPAKKK